MSPFTAEYVGTLLLLLLGNGVVANVLLSETKGRNSGWIVICTGWGLAVYVAVVVAGPVSGAHLNPAVTLSLAIAGKFPWSGVLPYMLAQMLGAMSGAFLVWLMYRDHYNRTDDPGLQLATFCTSPAIYNPLANLFSEAVGTFVLTYTVFYITGAEITTSKTLIGLGSVGALPVALVVWVIGLSLGGSTGYAINPARDLGPRIMHALLPMKGKGESHWSYSWIPVLGPLLGGVIGAVVYLALR
ncbi:MAG: MIP/aquaporin family protein [Chitinophagales bacterium]